VDEESRKQTGAAGGRAPRPKTAERQSQSKSQTVKALPNKYQVRRTDRLTTHEIEKVSKRSLFSLEALEKNLTSRKHLQCRIGVRKNYYRPMPSLLCRDFRIVKGSAMHYADVQLH